VELAILLAIWLFVFVRWIMGGHGFD